MKVPSDLQIIEEIYKRHVDDYEEWKEGNPARTNKNYVPVDITAVAKSLRVDVDIVWGRLYYDLDNRYSYQKSDNSWVHLFARRADTDKDCVHFPYLVSVLSSLRSKRWQLWVPAIFSGLAIIVSMASLAWTVRSDLHKEIKELPALESVRTETVSPKVQDETQAKGNDLKETTEKSITNQPIKPTLDTAAPSSGAQEGAAYQ
ncbi:hypothetical protein [Desulfurivibrio alkaliphilus]|uniref:Uncharacterized protein n=1 Tax=Desulfurivibrio alkaliphilus (strain DSM 19089 / UNIQEM U267 / AHT2) TaxID=589865 RepID=D6Z098_DESAT|nr:hypothetical protein [Desulfurivibrio alkaliphilus]ADH87131.1 hypothetical protein DaAHT2_2467 [Desulfurivibrio alkaliphilus AHT 2]